MVTKSITPVPVAEGFSEVIPVMDRVCAQVQWDMAALGGPRWPARQRHDRHILCLGIPRLTVIEAGCAGYGISIGGRRENLALGPGGVVHFASHAWNAVDWREPVRFLGLVFHRDFLRVLHCDHPGGGAAGGRRVSHHSREPVGRDLRGLLDALDAIAERGGGGDADIGACLRLVVRLARQHLASDLAGGPMTATQRTWQEALAWMQDHCTESFGREDAARVLGLHPNYLSTLCTKHGGRSFQRTLEAMRLERACALLRQQPDRPLIEIAHHSGFSDGDRLGRVFRAHYGLSPKRWARAKGTP